VNSSHLFTRDLNILFDHKVIVKDNHMPAVLYEPSLKGDYCVVDTGKPDEMWVSAAVEDVGTTYASYHVIGVHQTLKEAIFAVAGYDAVDKLPRTLNEGIKISADARKDWKWHFFD